jgi:hypothetical protein
MYHFLKESFSCELDTSENKNERKDRVGCVWLK